MLNTKIITWNTEVECRKRIHRTVAWYSHIFSFKSFPGYEPRPLRISRNFLHLRQVNVCMNVKLGHVHSIPHPRPLSLRYIPTD
jgi:hypothetical protein